MSWDEYVDEYLMVALDDSGRKLSSGAILGLDGGVWAQSEAFPELSQEEAETLVNGFDNPDVLQSKGIRFASTKYIPIAGEPGVIIRGKGLEHKATGFTAKKCNTCVVVGFYGEGVQPGECSKLVEVFADELLGMDY